MEADRKIHALAGTAAVALIFALSRWGSYIAVGPVFITDVFLALAGMHWLAGHLLNRPRTQRPSNVAPFAAIFVYAILRLIASPELSLVALRDAAPFLYALSGLLAAWSFRTSSSRQHLRTFRWLLAALSIHLLWALPVLLTDGALRGPQLSSTSYIFQIRADIDSGLVSILGGYALLSLLLDRGRRFLNLIVVSGVALCIISVPSRSAVIAFTSVSVFAMIVYFFSGARKYGKALLAVFLPIVGGVLVVLLLRTTPGSRLLATFGTADNAADLNAQGTTNARLEAWGILLDYWTADATRFVFGVGFGPNFLEQTGTDILLGSETFEGVRSPHNYLLSVAMRMGLVGFVLMMLLLAALAVATWRLRRKFHQEPLLFLCALTIVALVPPAMVGVVFEAPFGAVPFFWSAGILLSAAAGVGRTENVASLDTHDSNYGSSHGVDRSKHMCTVHRKGMRRFSTAQRTEPDVN